MAIGIGIDAAIATSLQARKLKTNKHAFTWILGVSLTHTLFPLFGYIGSYISIQSLPILTPFIGIIAFSLIAYFLWGEFQQLFIDDTNDHTLPSTATQSHERDESVLISLGLILAVSWDALWSGPAKSAQVDHWPEIAIWSSFILVGLIISLLTSISLFVSRLTKLQDFVSEYASLKLLAYWLQYSVIAYFAWLALLRYTFNLDLSWQVLLGISFGFTAIILMYKYIQENIRFRIKHGLIN